MKRGRKKKVRYIQGMPEIVQFSPRGKPGRPDEIELKVDQYEAFKLADYQGYHQDEGAKIMGISRPSFGRILREARKIVADALVNGKIIRIRIGDVQVGVLRKKMPEKSLFADNIEIEEYIKSNIMHFTLDQRKKEGISSKAKTMESRVDNVDLEQELEST